jgi:hypothetical protein
MGRFHEACRREIAFEQQQQRSTELKVGSYFRARTGNMSELFTEGVGMKRRRYYKSQGSANFCWLQESSSQRESFILQEKYK